MDLNVLNNWVGLRQAIWLIFPNCSDKFYRVIKNRLMADKIVEIHTWRKDPSLKWNTHSINRDDFQLLRKQLIG